MAMAAECNRNLNFDILVQDPMIFVEINVYMQPIRKSKFIV